MKTTLILLAGLVSVLTLASCGGDESASTAPADNYPLSVCVVSGKPLGSMGEPFVIEHEGTTVKFCCDGCLPKFNTSPDTYVAKLTPGE